MMTSMVSSERERKWFSTWMNTFVSLFESSQISRSLGLVKEEFQSRSEVEFPIMHEPIIISLARHTCALFSQALPTWKFHRQKKKKKKKKTRIANYIVEENLRIENEMAWIQTLFLICWMPLFWFYFHLLLRSTSGLGSIRNTCW